MKLTLVFRWDKTPEEIGKNRESELLSTDDVSPSPLRYDTSSDHVPFVAGPIAWRHSGCTGLPIYQTGRELLTLLP